MNDQLQPAGQAGTTPGATVNLNDLPAIGQPIESGIFAGVTTRADGAHCAVVLLADKPPTELKWKPAMDWAEGLGASLPTRPVAALLFSLLKDQFVREWHWTCESFDGSYAWSQVFIYGDQTSDRKSYEGRARAVRLIQLTA